MDNTDRAETVRSCSDTIYNDAAHLWRPTVGGHFAFSDGLESLADDLAGVDNGQSPPGAGNPAAALPAAGSAPP